MNGQELLQNNNCTQGNTLKVLQELLEKEDIKYER